MFEMLGIDARHPSDKVKSESTKKSTSSIPSKFKDDGVYVGLHEVALALNRVADAIQSTNECLIGHNRAFNRACEMYKSCNSSRIDSNL